MTITSSAPLYQGILSTIAVCHFVHELTLWVHQPRLLLTVVTRNKPGGFLYLQSESLNAFQYLPLTEAFCASCMRTRFWRLLKPRAVKVIPLK